MAGSRPFRPSAPEPCCTESGPFLFPLKQGRPRRWPNSRKTKAILSHPGASMSNNISAFSVPAFLRGHAILAELLRKAETHAAEHKIAASVLLTARLFPDMLPLTGQVQAACDTAKRATARLVGAEPPRSEDNEATFDELQDRIRRTSAYVESHAADGFPGDEDRKIEMKMGSIVIILTPREY